QAGSAAFPEPESPHRAGATTFLQAQLRVLCPAMEARRSSSDPCDFAPASGLGLLALSPATQDNTPRQRLVWLAGGNIGEFRINQRVCQGHCSGGKHYTKGHAGLAPPRGQSWHILTRDLQSNRAASSSLPITFLRAAPAPIAALCSRPAPPAAGWASPLASVPA